MTPEELREAVGKIRWFHSIDLGRGVVTPGYDPHTARRAAGYGIPDDLSGRSVLDIGAWDGFFSFEAERRGAARVVAVDSYCWSGAGWGTKDGFELARHALGSKVEDQEMEVLDLDPERLGRFDLVFCLGVLYHMRHPLLMVERVAAMCAGMLILETHVDLLDVPRPAMAFYPGCELNADFSNWCGPNHAMVEAMLRDVGFREVRLHLEERYPHDPAAGRAVYHALR
jgi:tRNA (mo5U34)-methyltransferase